ncbi:MAG: phage integrase SAM-like domain and Arm DNA-binding domain-containing protein, partial [Bacteroidota bacterium]
MPTVSPVLYHRPNKEGKYPIAIRITENRKSSYVFIGQAIEKNQWDKKTKKVRKNHPNSNRLNSLLRKKLAEVNSLQLSEQLKDKEPTAQTIHKTYLNNRGEVSFFSEAEKYLENLRKEGKYNRYVSDKPRIERFKQFVKKKDIKFEEISVSRLKEFRAYLKGRFKISERTIMNYLLVIRTIFNQGIKNGIVDQKYYPFGKGKMPIRFPESVKLGLSREEISKLLELELTVGSKQWHARN